MQIHVGSSPVIRTMTLQVGKSLVIPMITRLSVFESIPKYPEISVRNIHVIYKQYTSPNDKKSKAAAKRQGDGSMSQDTEPSPCLLCNSFNEFIQCNNLDFLKEICDCGKSMVLSNGNYYYCLGLMSDDRFSFAQLGELSYEKYFTFIEQNDWIKKMKKAEIEISNKEVPVAFGLCDICYNKFSKNFKSR